MTCAASTELTCAVHVHVCCSSPAKWICSSILAQGPHTGQFIFLFRFLNWPFKAQPVLIGCVVVYGLGLPSVQTSICSAGAFLYSSALEAVCSSCSSAHRAALGSTFSAFSAQKVQAEVLGLPWSSAELTGQSAVQDQIGKFVPAAPLILTSSGPGCSIRPTWPLMMLVIGETGSSVVSSIEATEGGKEVGQQGMIPPTSKFLGSYRGSALQMSSLSCSRTLGTTGSLLRSKASFRSRSLTMPTAQLTC